MWHYGSWAIWKQYSLNFFSQDSIFLPLIQFTSFVLILQCVSEWLCVSVCVSDSWRQEGLNLNFPGSLWPASSCIRQGLYPTWLDIHTSCSCIPTSQTGNPTGHKTQSKKSTSEVSWWPKQRKQTESKI